ncbi:putative cell differentiation protein [Piedraia hortae CBS 480.64]|uniref:Putative cell differentiation protein n=1 Tax=Piedraia hortae CBS 480.64 TaxID=1314780 RepID=A0A6A7C754_9PEZI|nr:putative cell differentiation protein [Piedraia hortae CBS 480.64]
MQPQHLFAHQHPYPHHQQDWGHPQPQQTPAHHGYGPTHAQNLAHHHQQPQPHHYGRLGATQGGNAAGAAGGGALNGTMGGINGKEDLNGLGMAINGLTGESSEDDRRVQEWVAQVLISSSRESALLELSKKREQVPELALILWHSFGVMTCLLQEIISVYPLLNPSQLTAAASNRVCNALALLQCVASHRETRGLFLGAHIPLFLYPFLNTTSKSRPFEYLRLTSLGVIGALVKNDSSEVINFLLTTEIIPLCLRIMETGSELSKTVAIFIVQKILLDDTGLQYICQTYERFYAVGTVLSNMVTQLVEQQTVRLLKHVVRCFLRLSDNARAREALRQCLPEPLRDATFSPVLRDDTATKRCLSQLLHALSDSAEPGIATHPSAVTAAYLNPGTLLHF